MNPDQNWEWFFNGRHRRTSDFKIQTLELVLRLWSNFKFIGDTKQMAHIYLRLRASRPNCLLGPDLTRQESKADIPVFGRINNSSRKILHRLSPFKSRRNTAVFNT